jgi:hypothetical protein
MLAILPLELKSHNFDTRHPDSLINPLTTNPNKFNNYSTGHTLTTRESVH